ncbi:MAG: hypothetical protein SXU28_08510 [Pseudomonadota bacterium]|nr:hypothetical protein [Pseudomonadota bacterium]
MIGEDRLHPSGGSLANAPDRRRGGPLAVLGVILAVWVTGRVFLWESPFAAIQLIEDAGDLIASDPVASGPALAAVQDRTGVPATEDAPARGGAQMRTGTSMPRLTGASSGAGLNRSYVLGQRTLTGLGSNGYLDSMARVRLASGHQMLWDAAMASGQGTASAKAAIEAKGEAANPPFFPAPSKGKSALDRWSLDGWAFVREGSRSAPVSQGRVPVYGASQAGAILQFRAAPESGIDPRIYLRGYRALIDRPETEIAAGVSARPVPSVPIRLAAELRATDNRFAREVRPALSAVTELQPVSLPLGASGEVYAGAGYVGGKANTAFIDGQASVTREVFDLGKTRRDGARLSVGAGAWGGAQRDANRLDLGPTVRLDLKVADVPARVSVDYRERVAGDAAPVSGVAATISTRF